MNLQQQEQFYQWMTRVKANSRAASTQDARATEMINGLLVSKPAKKVTDLSNLNNKAQERQESEPEVIDLQEYAKSGKAASVPGINKLREIAEFLSGKHN